MQDLKNKSNTNVNTEKAEAREHRDHANEPHVVPLVNIYETEEAYVLTAEMPGVPKENVSISLENRTLSLYGQVSEEYKKKEWLSQEFALADYYREFQVSTMIDAENIKATVKNGLLTLHLPKAPEAKPRKINIDAE